MKNLILTTLLSITSIFAIAQNELKGSWEGKNRHNDAFKLEIGDKLKWTTFSNQNPQGNSAEYNYEVLSNDSNRVVIKMTPQTIENQDKPRTDYFVFVFDGSDSAEVKLRANNEAQREFPIGTISRKK